ncbi:hypothetical protein [Teredinibacter sp. KSP-S5-2]|uniref:hypothetical protein n=1 Tax=Teredinibacter sp. KSP-S5-2 TaxID=3034506 RepID=UPI002934D4C8|nr:hypothetical protein [Teredinibacter sp. KSP-S5-2]WNO10413.1 hypothetical protein P5V12_04440 [Teredinibacter sp. KSP-S5-2]
MIKSKEYQKLADKLEDIQLIIANQLFEIKKLLSTSEELQSAALASTEWIDVVENAIYNPDGPVLSNQPTLDNTIEFLRSRAVERH